MATFDRNQVKEWIAAVENESAEFIGSEFAAARIIGFISSQHEEGLLTEAQAEQLLADAELMLRLIKLGRKYAKLVRKPSAEIEIMVLADYQKERKYT